MWIDFIHDHKNKPGQLEIPVFFSENHKFWDVMINFLSGLAFCHVWIFRALGFGQILYNVSILTSMSRNSVKEFSR